MQPLCFVLMPFGVKSDASGGQVDFDAVYRDVIAPAVAEAEMEPLRADEERDGGIIHKPMFERLALCSFAVADLTLANANVFYELGVRHAVRPHTTVLMFARGGPRLPFDVSPLRAIPYEVDDDGVVTEQGALRAAIRARLAAARNPVDDSPVYQLLDGFVAPDISRLRADTFRDRVRYGEEVRARLAAARRAGDAVAAVRAVHADLHPVADKDAGVAVDLLLSYRDVGDFAAVIQLSGELPAPVAASVLAREQLALALNREGRDAEAEAVLQQLLDERGSSSETLGLLGRIYKDRWLRASRTGSPAAPALLARAIDAYRRGYEADWRDVYPGVNAVTLLELQDPGQEEVGELVPVVRYAARRRAEGAGDYWDHATLLELAVIARDESDAAAQLGEALADGPAPWMRDSTANNLIMLADARDAMGEDTTHLRGLVGLLRATPAGGASPE